MKIENIFILLLSYMKVNKAKKQDYEELKYFIKKSKIFSGKKKMIYKKIIKFKN